MKRYSRFYLWLLILLMPVLLNGCGGYARTSDHSGAQVYGTVDVGVMHQR
jgi:hypothetical protein